MTFLEQDRHFMKRAIELAQKGCFTTHPNPNVGCVIVNEKQQIIGEGYHHKAGQNHAEKNALSQTGSTAKGATVYVTLEPCNHYGKMPPCSEALIRAGVARVVIALLDPNSLVSGRGIAQLQTHGIATTVGVLAEEAEALNKGFLKRMRTGKPYVQLKLAASLDGRIALASGESKWITSEESRRDVQRFRAQSSAILSTSATILADDPSLTVRWQELPAETQSVYPENELRQPMRVIIDNHNRVKTEQQLFTTPSYIALIRKQIEENYQYPDFVQQVILPASDEYIELSALMQWLGEMEQNSVWVESGSRFATLLLNENLVDEFILYLAPKLLGDHAKALFELPELKQLSDAYTFQFLDAVPIGKDLRLRFKPR